MNEYLVLGMSVFWLVTGLLGAGFAIRRLYSSENVSYEPSWDAVRGLGFVTVLAAVIIAALEGVGGIWTIVAGLGAVLQSLRLFMR